MSDFGDFEFERKFLVLDMPAVAASDPSPVLIAQAYLFAADGYAVRVRLQGPAPAGLDASPAELLTTLAAEFSPRTYIGEEFSLVDCTLAPVLWRLNHYGVELPKHQHERLHSYARRLFARPAFERSLSPIEAQMGTAGAP